MTEKYIELKKTYKELPDIEWIETQFGISVQEKNIVEINLEIATKIEEIIETLENLLVVKESYKYFLEHNFLDKSDKEKIYNCFKSFNSHIWKFYSNYINGNIKMHVNWILETKNLFEKYKKNLSEVFEKLGLKWAETKEKIE
ncbi:MAG: hypothetical protein QXF15_03135 [Candidatus Aenigmatarchaeota archaeon]|nr:hypothetical protein [Candidatus Aenigmarchaeota archaeon]